jgi:hypothetical protein
MSPKLLRIPFLLVAFAGLAVWAKDLFIRATAAPPPAATAASAAPAREVVVTYFTTNIRCESCLTIERLTRESLDKCFAAELADGRVRFQMINTSLPENRHFTDDYDISLKTVVVSDRRAGREVNWKRFDQVWELLDDPAAFHDMLCAGVRGVVAAEPKP